MLFTFLATITRCISSHPTSVVKVPRSSITTQPGNKKLKLKANTIANNDESTRPSLAAVYSTSFLVIMGASMVAFSPAPALIQQLGTASATRILAMLSAAAALMEITFSPAVGSLMDSVGRKPVLLASIVALAVSNGMVALHPTVTFISIAKVSSAFVAGLFFITSQAIMSDSTASHPERMSSAIGVQLSLTSLGFLFGAIAAGRLAEKGLTVAYGTSSAVVAIAACIAATMTESLQPSERVVMEHKATRKLLLRSPLSATRIFRHKEIRVMTILLMLSSLPTFAGDFFQIYSKSEWGLEAKDYSTFIAMFGVIGICGNVVGSVLVRRIGIKRFTAIATLSSICIPIGATFFQFRGLKIGALIGFLSSAQRMGITAALVSEGAKSGVPQGELAGERSSIVALLKVVGPIWYSMLYVQGKNLIGVKNLPFIFNIVISLLAFSISVIHL
jgi:predicted MFS family arabinose efflux permease